MTGAKFSVGLNVDNRYLVKANHLTLIEIWESSVRATHDFLAEENLQESKPFILEHYFDAVDLRCAKDAQGEIQVFCGVYDGNIAMAFSTVDARGKGVGAMLAAYAINELALRLYQHIGFKVIGRSPVDGQGKPYPLLHMAL